MTEEQKQSVVSADDELVSSVEFFQNAEAFYKLLGSIYYLELTQDQIDALAQLDFAFPDDGSEMSQACKELKRYLNRRGSDPRQDLACDYARIFLAAGVYEGDTAVPYESVYTSEDGIMMQDSRDDAVRIYRENGLAIPRDLNVPEDHLAFELEFMSHMSNRIAQALEAEEDASKDMQTQLDFIDGHLLNWIPQLEERVRSFAKFAFYPAIVKMTKSYLEEHKAVLLEELEG